MDGATDGGKRSPALGLPNGWVKEDVQRRNGIYAGKYDTYYYRFVKSRGVYSSEIRVTHGQAFFRGSQDILWLPHV